MPGSTATNPYSAPLPDEPVTASAQPWSLAGGVLLVSDGARLPPVNLLGPQDDPDIIPVTVSYVTRPWASFCITLLLILMVALTAIASDLIPWSPPFRFHTILPGIIGFEVFLGLLSLKKSGRVKVRFHASRALLIKQSRRVSIHRRITLAAITAILVTFFLFRPLPTALLGFLAAVILLSALSLTLAIRPFCSRIRGNWAHISRISPAAMARLTALAANPPPPLPPLKVRIFTFYGSQLSIRKLIDGRWNRPWLVISALIAKARSAKSLIIDYIHESDASLLAAVPPPLATMAEQLPALEWKTLRIRRQEALAGNALIESVDLLSPDLCHQVSPILATAIVSRGRVPELVTFQRWIIASVLVDGTVVSTRTSPLNATVRDFEIHLASGAPAELWEKHLAVIGSRPVQPATEFEWLTRLETWAETVHQALVATGFRSPVREIEMPAEIPVPPVTNS